MAAPCRVHVSMLLPPVSAMDTCSIHRVGESRLVWAPGVGAPGARHTAEMDVVLQGATQAETFDAVGQRVIDDALNGHNHTLIAIGPREGGKTWTMFGGPRPEEQGLVPRACAYILQAAANSDADWTVDVRASFAETSSYDMRDVLQPRTAGSVDMHDGWSSLSEVAFTTAEEAAAVLRVGLCGCRADADCDIIFTLWLRRLWADGNSTTGRCVFVDVSPGGSASLQRLLRRLGRVPPGEIQWKTPLSKTLKPALTGIGKVSFVIPIPDGGDASRTTECAMMLRFAEVLRELWTLSFPSEGKNPEEAAKELLTSIIPEAMPGSVLTGHSPTDKARDVRWESGSPTASASPLTPQPPSEGARSEARGTPRRPLRLRPLSDVPEDDAGGSGGDEVATRASGVSRAGESLLSGMSDVKELSLE